MQNSNSINTLTTDTNSASARETERPTLAELLAARDEERHQQEIARDRNAQQEREQERREALDYVGTWVLAHVSDDLRAALQMNYAVDDSRLDDDDGYHDNYAFARAGYATLDLAGFDVDDNAAARFDPNGGAMRWRISREYVAGDPSWCVCGPLGYCVSLDEGYANVRNVDATLLDALAAYPAWEAQKIAASVETADAEQERIAEATKAERQRYEERYVTVESALTYGRPRMRLEFAGVETSRTLYATIEDATDVWLLVNVEATGDADTHQKLIPVARVVSMTPISDDQPTA